jgi:hypothetical protein
LWFSALTNYATSSPPESPVAVAKEIFKLHILGNSFISVQVTPDIQVHWF